jgi:hypothetical protein
MRTLIVACTLAVLGASGAAQAADVYVPPPRYGYAPPPRVYAPPPQVYVAPPVVYERPAGIIAVPQGPAYVVPAPVYQPGDEYAQEPFLVDARRYYRDCWFENGQRRCTLWPRWPRLALP